MSSDQSDSANVQIVRSILDSLARVRLQKQGWVDSEKETENETLVFKIGESLRCFLTAHSLAPEFFSSPSLSKDVFHSDIRRVLTTTKNSGFFPSPYSPIPGVNDQYTDFAAFCLEFADLVFDYATTAKQKQIQALAKAVGAKALAFLTNPKHFRNDEAGCRWAGTSVFHRTRRGQVVEYYTDAYFTSLVMIALRKTLERPVLGLSSKDKDKLRNLIRNAGKWLISRSDAGLLTGDEKKNIKKLLYSTWGLRALVETYDIQEDEVRRSVPPLVGAYVSAIGDIVSQGPVSVGQEYVFILSPSVDEPLHYEDRSDWGGILLTLIKLRSLPQVDELLERLNYRHTLDAVYNGVMLLRDPTTKLWYRDFFILSIHQYLVESLVLYDKHAKDFGVEVGITASMLRKALKDALSDDSILGTMQQLVYQSLLKATEQARQNRTIEKGLEDFNNSE